MNRIGIIELPLSLAPCTSPSAARSTSSRCAKFSGKKLRLHYADSLPPMAIAGESRILQTLDYYKTLAHKHTMMKKSVTGLQAALFIFLGWSIHNY